MSEGPNWIGVIACVVLGALGVYGAASPHLWTSMDVRDSYHIARARLAAGGGVVICLFAALDQLLR